MKGIACGGNWIVDQVKIIDRWPPKGELVNILEEDSGIGGGPANVLTDLIRLGFPHPTSAIGCIGRDSFGEQVLAHCRRNGIAANLLSILPEERTSYTDVMTIRGTGERTFFHYRGANSRFCPTHVSVDMLQKAGFKMFYLGYLLLLDSMDAADEDGRVTAVGMLESIREAGIETCLDVVSEASERFQTVVVPALPHVDHCVINEIEAERITGVQIRTADGPVDQTLLTEAASRLLELGVKRTAVIHFREGSVWLSRDGGQAYQAWLDIPQETIVGSVGAGDAFCAGILYGIHESWSAEKSLRVATGAATSSLRAASATDGVLSLPAIEELCRTWS